MARFGGHETFHIRDGWLHKGLMLLKNDAVRLIDDDVSDDLGVGRNMAKSIKHWLLATGLSRREKAGAVPELTCFGEQVLANDPHLLDPGTWWALHVNLVNEDDHAGSWVWFFNHFNLARFDKAVCLDRLCRHLEQGGKRVPSTKTLDRDLSCLLGSYSQKIPAEALDPEDSLICPFTELGLLNHYSSSGKYQLEQGRKAVPSHLIGYSVAKAIESDGDAFEEPGKYHRVDILKAEKGKGSPGRVFCLSRDALYEALNGAEESLSGAIRIERLAGEDQLLVKKKESPLEWLEEYYTSPEVEREVAAYAK